MKYILLSFLLASAAHATTGDIQCTASYDQTDAQGHDVEAVSQSFATENNSGHLRAEGMLKNRTFILNGNNVDDSFLVTQVWGSDFTVAVNTTAAFDKNGRLQISTIDDVPRVNGAYAGSIVYKYLCTRVR